MGSTGEMKTAIDLSHHINKKSKARHPSPLKDIIKYMGYDGMISFAGGLPHPSLFAFGDASFSAYRPGAIPGSDGQDSMQTFPLTKNSKSTMNLIEALQYGGGTGDLSLLKWCRRFVTEVFTPAYSDFEILLSGGNTDAWQKVVGLLCEEGDYILCEEHTYPSAQALWIPMGCKAAPVKMDGEGLRADHLAEILDHWDGSLGKKPHLLYLVPVGSNPAGTTMGGKRKQDIYDVCARHDVIICEDDPYYWLQYEDYQLGSVFAAEEAERVSVSEYAKSLVPSFLSLDVEGRVIRLETFSKTLAPGGRLGYFIANPLFTERLLRATEVETQAPSGWSQIIVSNLLHNWGTEGYLLWLSNLRNQYRGRRDWMCDAISKNFHVQKSATAESSSSSFIVTTKDSKNPIFTFVAPSAGMFIWARFELYNSPKFQQLQSQHDVEDPEQKFSDEVWAELAKALVLVTPGSYYIPWQGKDKKTTSARGAEKGVGYFRLAFSMTSREEIERGVERMAKVLQDFW